MISMMAFCQDIMQLIKVKHASRTQAQELSSDKWLMHFYSVIEDVMEKVSETPKLDIICFDIGENEGISHARYLRKCYEKAWMILMADESVSPMEYIRPDIMPAGLLISPTEEKEVERVIREVFEKYLESIQEKEVEKLYIVSTREELIRIPYRSIIYFESRNKKIYIRHGDQEVGFYSTLEKVEAELEGDFVRAHRSFLVNRDKIQRFDLKNNEVILKNSLTVPISRKYKPRLKENNYGR